MTQPQHQLCEHGKPIPSASYFDSSLHCQICAWRTAKVAEGILESAQRECCLQGMDTLLLMTPDMVSKARSIVYGNKQGETVMAKTTAANSISARDADESMVAALIAALEHIASESGAGRIMLTNVTYGNSSEGGSCQIEWEYTGENDGQSQA